MKVCRRCGQNMALRTGLTCPGHTTGCHEWEEVNNKTEKPMTTAPAWHDKPTEPGLWVARTGTDKTTIAVIVVDVTVLVDKPNWLTHPFVQWFGPIQLPHAVPGVREVDQDAPRLPGGIG